MGDGIGDACRNMNRLPVAEAGPDQIVECSIHNGGGVTLDASNSYDPDNHPLTYTWTGTFGTVTGKAINVVLPLGTNTIILAVSDGKTTASDTVSVTVQDTKAPTLNVIVTPNLLWPANHEIVDIAATIQVGDICDANPTVRLLSIASSEPDNGLGDGDTAQDIQNAAFGTDDRLFSLRAERSGKGPGRFYAITYEAIDHSGNATLASVQVKVPNNMGK
jgi:hypothetical protein